MGKIPRTGGSLKINHKDLEIHTLRKVIGYVPQVFIFTNNSDKKKIILILQLFRMMLC